MSSAFISPAPSTVATNTQNETREGLSYNNQSINLADIKKYRPLCHMAFDWYPPNIKHGIQRSLDPMNTDQINFNVTIAANRSCLLYANKINHFVMDLNLTNEQRRYVL